MPLLGLDALGSAPYGPEAALTILIPLGAIGLHYMPLVVGAVILVVFGGITDKLIPLFAFGAFGAFTLSQAGMVMHWRRLGRSYFKSPSLLINGFGALTTGAALIIIFLAKFVEGAWVTALIIPLFIAGVRRGSPGFAGVRRGSPGFAGVRRGSPGFAGVRRHHAYVKSEIRPPLDLQTCKVRPLKVVLPIDGWTRVSERALRFALRISEDIVAVHVTPEETSEALIETWRNHVEEPARQAGLPPLRSRSFTPPIASSSSRCSSSWSA